MGTMKQNQQGFTLVETLLIILIVAVIGFGGYYVWHSQHTSSSTTTKSTAPAGWKTYISTTDKFSTVYPATWTYTASSSKANTIYASDSNINVFSVDFSPPAPKTRTSTPEGPSSPYYEVGVINESVAQELQDDEKVLVTGNNGTGSAVTSKILSVTTKNFDGYSAQYLETKITDNATGVPVYDVDVIFAANNLTYDFYAQSKTSAPLTNSTIKTAFDAFKIQ